MSGGIDEATVDWDAHAPRSIFFDDIYFSDDGAAEAAHVFLAGNDLASRFVDASQFTIGELGFGTGLNFLAAADLWRRSARKAGARLEFLSFEKHPLTKADLARAHAAWPQFRDWSERLIETAPPPVEGLHRLDIAPDIALTLVYGEALAMLARLEAGVDAWFFDGFAPAKNPDMWSPEIFVEVARLSRPGASAATFTVAGAVRRALMESGFSIAKRPGFGRKRDMLTARFEGGPSPLRRAPWFANANLRPLDRGARVAIIGGGVAGASLAFELSRTGALPTIFAPKGLADGASGNPAGLIMPRIDLSDDPGARFFRSGYLATLARIDQLQRESSDVFFNPCGVLLKATTTDELARQDKIYAAGLLPERFIEKRAAGLFFPQAGVIDPARFCQALAGRAEIVTASAAAILSGKDGVRIEASDGARRDFDAVFIANGRDALKFVAARSLPLSGVMGQIDHFPAAASPSHATAFGPYAAPAPMGGLVIGATYAKIEVDEAPRTSIGATAENLSAIAAALPDAVAGLAAASAQPRAAIRCQTPDRLPVAGPLPDWNFYSGAYDDLRLGRNRDFPAGETQPGFFILSGLGSGGLVTAPFAAAQIVAEATGQPFEREIADAIHPARFFIRDLKRGRAPA